MALQDTSKIIPIARVRELLNARLAKPIHKATVDRWINAGVLPPPVIVNGRRYWRDDVVDARLSELFPDAPKQSRAA